MESLVETVKANIRVKAMANCMHQFAIASIGKLTMGGDAGQAGFQLVTLRNLQCPISNFQSPIAAASTPKNSNATLAGGVGPRMLSLEGSHETVCQTPDKIVKPARRMGITYGLTPPVAPPVTPPVEVLTRLLDHAGELGNADIRRHLGLKERTHLRERYLAPALAEGLIEPTLPDKPNSRLQKYRLTAKGKAMARNLSQPGS